MTIFGLMGWILLFHSTIFFLKKGYAMLAYYERKWIGIMEITKKFKRTKEDFKCIHCGLEIEGNGYTNHCPNCLWSLHVDINPGDRQAKCRGEMIPSGVFKKNGEYFLVHKCEKCGLEKNNKVSTQDNFDKILSIASRVK